MNAFLKSKKTGSYTEPVCLIDNFLLIKNNKCNILTLFLNRGKCLKNLSILFLCSFVFVNHHLQGMDKPNISVQPISVSFSSFLQQNQTLSGNDIAQKALSLLQNTNLSVNQQNQEGNTLAHLLSPIAIEDRALLVNIFNEFIKKNIDPRILNNKGQTAKNVALDKNHRHRHWCYASNANLFHRLEMGFSPNGKFVLESDNMTISFKIDHSASL
jgi:hypothetical protein